MLFEYKYKGFSGVKTTPKKTAMSFVPDAARSPTWFRGTVHQALPFREAISALHDVVVSDLRYTPKDREEYKRWVAEQEEVWLAEYMSRAADNKARIEEIRRELSEVYSRKQQLLKPFYTARQRYFDYLWKNNRDWWYVLDPVITVHPDEVFFECFSEDESTYARLSCGHEVFTQLDDFACGTTNIDYSAELYDEFQKIRTYRDTELTVDPQGFSVQTAEDEAHREVKIDLPDSWVRGFLQVSSAMNLPGYDIDLHPMDLHNICFKLRQRREKEGPRSLRFQLEPGEPVSIVFDPWGTVLECPRSTYHGHRTEEVRIWGRRRLHVLERLIPVAKSVKLKLLGYGMPSFWLVDLGDMQFTLGLSGWTANDWSKQGNFDLLAPRADVTPDISKKVLEELDKQWVASSQTLAQSLQLPHADVLGALSAATQAGLAIYDLSKEVWRARPLSREPLPLEKLRFENEREEKAMRLIGEAQVSVERGAQARVLRGRVHGNEVRVVIDLDERMVEGECTCNFHGQNKLRKGPCEHILATRMKAKRTS
ncbi:SWIM zinc finger family protein [Persicimonas caeni]|uniref:SWIM zinc finger family protein n=1 Tax=Persicimonas caeni TaxID=2292766 RepID=A0A4Y6PY31_PERCE|nr:SWIM zinc finger family protein [Persicimonas caeni]QDG53069.1 SWIM zinc finger family protein [Persicimonas caeni]QED34291.1 SWIM zinc finger family protein [Persicimonas caeni]